MTEEVLDDQLDQTFFSSEEPLLEEKTQHGEKKATKGKKPKVYVIVIGFIIVLVSIALIALIMLRAKPTLNDVLPPDAPTPTTSIFAPSSQLEQLFLELDQTVEDADPSDPLLPIPPVSDEILVVPRRR